ncbi:MAG: glycerate dehydrogenase [Candidatus Latescibacteria bacterium]|nr:glycerate dehydrogenase [Candidatus Latescibacterota bacterium]
MKKIVAPDGVLLNDARRARLAAHGDLSVHAQRPSGREELLQRLAGAHIALINEAPMGGDLLRALPGLEMISLWSAGYNHVDLRTARDLGITVCHAPGCSATAIAEHTLAVAVYFTRRLKEADRHVRAGRYAWETFVDPELRSQTFGVIGFGRVGARVAEYAGLLGCRVLVHTRRPSPDRAAGLKVTFVDLDTLLRESDILSIHTALTPETEGLIGPSAFRQMVRRPILINTARGRVVDQDALLQALRSGQIRAAALDVLRDEPPDPADPLLQMENVLFTPHSAGNSPQAFECLSETCVRNVEAYLAGRPQHVVTE